MLLISANRMNRSQHDIGIFLNPKDSVHKLCLHERLCFFSNSLSSSEIIKQTRFIICHIYVYKTPKQIIFIHLESLNLIKL